MFEPFLSIAETVRAEMIQLYGNDLAGKCIEASEKIVKKIFSILGIEAVAVEGWCRYDIEDYGSDRPWDPHTWVEVPPLNLYIDVTADQFNYGMYSENDFPPVIVRKGLPFGMCYSEPTWNDYEEDNDMTNCVDDLIMNASEEATVRAFKQKHPGLTLETSGWSGVRITFRNSDGNFEPRVSLPFLPEKYCGEKDGFLLTVEERQKAYEELSMYGVDTEDLVIESAEMFRWPFEMTKEQGSKSTPAFEEENKSKTAAAALRGANNKVSSWLASHSLAEADETFAWSGKKDEMER